MRFPDARASLGGLARDAAGGANLALAMLPKAMAYAAVAGVPPAYGLYASCVAPALAVAFGNNRLLFTGPVGVMTVLVLGSLHHFAHTFSAAYIALAATLALMVAILPRFLADAAEAWSRGDVLVPALFAACIASALLARRHFPRIPDAFFVIVLAVAAVFVFGLEQ